MRRRSWRRATLGATHDLSEQRRPRQSRPPPTKRVSGKARRARRGARTEERRRNLRDRRTRIAAVLFLTHGGCRCRGGLGDQVANGSGRCQTHRRYRKSDADIQRTRAETAVEMIQRSLLIRQAALSGDKESLSKTALVTDQNTSIRFGAGDTDLVTRIQVIRRFKFELYPNSGTLPTGKRCSIYHVSGGSSTFQNTLMTTGAERNFRASYTGWGCLEANRCLIEYKDPTRPYCG